MPFIGCLPDAFEAETVFILSQPASEGHALAVEGDGHPVYENLPTDNLTHPCRHISVAVLFSSVEHSAETHGTVVIQTLNLSLAKQVVVGFDFFWRYFQLPEGWLEDAMAREVEHVAKAPVAAFVLIGHQAAAVQDFRRLASGFHVP